MRKAVLVTLFYCVLAAPLGAQVTTEEGTAKHLPWSGYWWPIAKGELLGPLGKYDVLTGAAAASWERRFHPPGPHVPGWQGYCHGWAASAVLEFEPRSPRWTTGPHAMPPVLLSIGDQKGILAAAHTRDVANTYGERFGDRLGREDPDDIYPDYFWQVLRRYIKQLGVPLVADMDPGPEVWNYPIFAYRLQYAPYGPAGQQLARLAIWGVDDAVPPDHVGMVVHYQTYTFTFRLHQGAVVMGSGRWVGQSKENHPDFVWYPYVVTPENPQVSYPHVKQLIATTRPPVRPQTPPGAAAPSVSAVPPGPVPGRPPAATHNSSPAPAASAAPLPNSTVPALSGGSATSTGIPDGVPVSPLEIVAMIAEKASSFNFDITVDRFDGGEYTVGDPCTVKGVSDRAGYLYLFYVDSNGGLAVLYPAPSEDNRVAAAKRFTIPAPASSTGWRLQGPPGTHRIKAVVTDRPLLLTGLTWPGDAGQKSLEAGSAAGRFHWNPTQERQVAKLLQEYQQRKELPPAELDGLAAKQLLPGFAQDEVLFYVGPREEPKP